MAGGKIDILVEPDVKGFGGKLESGLSGALGVAGKVGAALGVALGMGELSRQVVTVGMDFQSQLNTMAAVSQATGAEIDAVADRARQLGNDTSLTAVSASDAAAAMTELAKGGFSVDQSMEAARGTLQLASAAQVDAATAATIQSQALQAFSLSAEDASRVSDILAGAANASSAEMTDVSSALQQAGTVANQFGISIEDTATAVAMFANAGITGSDAGTLLKSALLALTDQSKPAQAAIDELGLTVYDAQGKFVGMESLMGQLKDAAGEMTDEQYQAATATLFGSDAMRLAGIAAEQGSDGFSKLREAVTRQGQAAEVAAAQTEGLPGAYERLQNAAEEAFLGIFEEISDKLVAGADMGVAAIEKIGPVAASSAGLAVDAIGGIVGVLGDLAGVVSPIVGGLGDLAGGFEGIIGPAAGFGLALATSSYIDFPGRMNSGTGALRRFGEQMKVQQALALRTGREIGTIGSAIATMEARVPTIHRMNDAFRRGSSPLMTLGHNARESAREMTGFQRVAGVAKGSLQTFGGVAKGVATGGLSLLKGGLSSLVNFMGGPWGLAFAGAGLVIGKLVQDHQEAARAAEEHAAAQRELKGSLDETTGGITAQTEALLEKKLEESGAADAARNLGLAQSTVMDAITGNASAQRQVLDETSGAIDAFIAANDKYNGVANAENRIVWEENGLGVETFRDALLGVPDALAKVEEQGAQYTFNQLKEEIQGSDDAAAKLGLQVAELQGNLNDVQTEQTTDQIRELERQSQMTKDALGVLGDTLFQIEGEKTISIAADAMTDETRTKLEDIGVKVSEPFEGRVNIEFPDGMDILQMLDSIGLKISDYNGYIRIDNHETEEAKQALEELKLTTTTLPDGTVVINSNDPEVRERLISLGLLVEDPKTGTVTISDNVDPVAKRVDSLNNRNTQSTHTVIVWEDVRGGSWAGYYGNGGRGVSSGGTSVGQHYADGTLRDQQAQMAKGGEYLLWAESETEGESFIPHAPSKRDRAKEILAGTADIFGMTLFDTDGTAYRKRGLAVGGVAGNAYADGGFRSARQIKDGIRFMDGTAYIMGGWSPAGVDCSGGVALTVNVGKGLPPFDSRMSTQSEGPWLAQKGFRQGRGSAGDVVVGWYDYGGGANGHTAMQLQDGTYVESGGNTGGGLTIGRGAGPLDGRGFTNFMHYPGGKEGKESANGRIPEWAGPNGAPGRSGGGHSVSFGEAQDLFDTALKYLKSGRTYDTGGRFPTGTLGRNASGKDELVLTNWQWKQNSDIARSLPLAGSQFDRAASRMLQAADKQIEAAQRGVLVSGRNLGGDWLGRAQIVQDAEQGLLETRKSIAEEAEAVTKAEEDLAEARKELRKTEKEGKGLSTSMTRKLEDAEDALNKARASGKADKIADAQKRLNRANEDAAKELEKSKDKNAKAMKSAIEDVRKAEETLTEARLEHSDAAERLEAAERTIVAARYQALGDMAEGILTHIADGFKPLTEYFDEMSRLAGIVDQTRQSVSKLRMEQVTNDIARLKALQDLQIKELDVARTRADGAIGVARAEWELEQARGAAALMGATSIEAMRGAMDRYRLTGIFAVEEITDSVIANTAAIRAAEWGVQAARAQAALDNRLATHEQALAQLDVLEATLTQNAAAEMLRLQTAQLAKQTAELYGMTANSATGASRGFGGVSNVVGGLGKILGGVLASAAGFAVGGPLGALAGAGMALGGLTDVVKGGIDIHVNKDDMAEAWAGMGTADKAGIILGGIGGAALTIGGGVASAQYGPEMAVGGAELGAKWMEATIGGVQHSIASKIDKINRDAQDAQDALTLNVEAEKLRLEAERAALQLQQTSEREALKATLDFANLQKELAAANTKAEAEALAAAAQVAAQRREKMIELAQQQNAELLVVSQSLGELVEQTRETAATQNTGVKRLEYILPPGESFTRGQVTEMMRQTAEALGARITELEAAGTPTADDYLMSTIR